MLQIQPVKKKLNLKNDVIFKTFFSRKGNEEFLIDFLNALLKIEITKIKIKAIIPVFKMDQNLIQITRIKLLKTKLMVEYLLTRVQLLLMNLLNN